VNDEALRRELPAGVLRDAIVGPVRLVVDEAPLAVEQRIDQRGPTDPYGSRRPPATFEW
jgi:hypothetical protein